MSSEVCSLTTSDSCSVAGYDVIAQAQSGTGKTATFAISILQQIELDLKATQALVLAPTRELAQQVSVPSVPFSMTGLRMTAAAC